MLAFRDDEFQHMKLACVETVDAPGCALHMFKVISGLHSRIECARSSCTST